MVTRKNSLNENLYLKQIHVYDKYQNFLSDIANFDTRKNDSVMHGRVKTINLEKGILQLDYYDNHETREKRKRFCDI